MGWNCRIRLARPNSQARTGTGKNSCSLFSSLTASRICSLTRLILILAIYYNHTCIHTHTDRCSHTYCWNKLFSNRFICVGVDISIHALLTGERSSYSPVLSHVLYPHSVVLSVLLECISVILDYSRHGYVLYRTIIIKTCVYTIYTCRAEVPVPHLRLSH